MARSVTITVGALAGVLRAQEIGEPPVLVQPNLVWTDPEADRKADAAKWTEFAEVGLVDRRGRLDGDVLDTLHVLARPSVEYQVVFTTGGRENRVVIAVRGDEAVLAYREGNAVTLTSLRRAPVAETLLRQIPDARPAPIGTLNVRVTDLASLKNREDDPFGDAGSTAQQAHALAILAKARLLGQGELYVGVRDHSGRRQLSPPIRYQDYKVGRVVIITDAGYLSVAPASKQQLLTRLRDAHQALADE